MKWATGLLIFLASVLLLFSARNALLTERLLRRFDVLEARVKSPPPRLAAPPPAASPVPGPIPVSVSETGTPLVEKEAPDVAVPTTTGFTAPRTFGPRKSKPQPAPRVPTAPDLTPEQKTAIDGVLDSQRRERLQIDGDTAFRHRELDRRVAAQIRSWLTPEQQRAFDESQGLPRPDGPLTASAQTYIQKDPAPYDLEVEWGGEWWPARTKDVRGELTLIHYVGHGEEWHEWVGPERVRPRR